MASNYHASMDDPNVWVTYRYDPSVAAAAAAVGLFGVATLLHVALLVRRRTWYFIPFCVGGVFEIVGYAGRILSSRDIWALGPYIAQSILLLVAPALFAASIYIVLGRVILHVRGEACSPVPRRWLTTVFVGGDVVAFLLQAGGGGYQAAGTLAALDAGNDVIIAGLFAQLASFGVFIAVASVFHVRFRRRCRASPSAAECIPGGPRLWQRQMAALYAGSALVLVRSVFRAIEYLMGNDGYLLRHEVFLYVFDGLLMLSAMVVFLVAHPSQVTRLTGSAAGDRITSSGTGTFMLEDVRKADETSGGDA